MITGNHEGGMPPDYGGARRVDVVTQLHTVYGHGKTGRAVRQLAALAGDGVGRVPGWNRVTCPLGNHSLARASEPEDRRAAVSMDFKCVACGGPLVDVAARLPSAGVALTNVLSTVTAMAGSFSA